MELVTREEVKRNIGITGTEKDSTIDGLIPPVTSMFFDLTNNYFYTNLSKINILSDAVKFLSADKSINDENSDFSTIKPNMTIRISGSGLNDGFFKVVTVEENKITVAEDIHDEDFGMSVRINQSVIPDSVKLVLSRMVNVFLPTGKEKLKSERFSDFQASFLNSIELQAEIDELISPYKKIKWE